MFFCELIDVPTMPTELKRDILSYIEGLKKRRVEFALSYGTVDTQDSESGAYIADIKQYIKQHGMPRPVSFWEAETQLLQRVSEWLHDTPYRDADWKIQYVKGNSSIAPHIDVRRARTRNLVYVIQPGGLGVTTTWWTSDHSFPETTAIPFDRLELAHSEVLHEDRMYMLNVSCIHSVSKFTQDRIMLSSNIL